MGCVEEEVMMARGEPRLALRAGRVLVVGRAGFEGFVASAYWRGAEGATAGARVAQGELPRLRSLTDDAAPCVAHCDARAESAPNAR